MVGIDDGAGTEVDFDEEMNEDLTINPERVLQTTPVVYLGEASRAAALFNYDGAANRSQPARRVAMLALQVAGSRR